MCHEFISRGGVRALCAILIKDDASTQMKEEAVWTITNLSMVSSMYEGEFEQAASILMEYLKEDKIDNLASVLNLKQQSLQALGNLVIDSAHLRRIVLGENCIGIRHIIQLIFFNRVTLSE